MELKGKNWIIIFAVLFLFALALGMFFAVQKYGPEEKEIQTSGISGSDFVTETPQALPTVEGGTRSTIVESQVIPTPEVTRDMISGTNIPKDIAIPENISNPSGFLGAHIQGSIREFNVSIEDNRFDEKFIVVNEKDVLDMKLFAKDKEYIVSLPDFGILRTIPKFQTAHIQFQTALYGSFSVLCKNCGAETVLGTIIVNKK